MSDGTVPPQESRDPVTRLIFALQIELPDRTRLLEALTHRSYVNETTDPDVRDNERLEFLGDAVIDLVVSTELMKRFPSAREGALSRMRASMVNESGLAHLARRLDLGSALRLGRGEELSGGRDRASLMSDAYEALIAAIYLELGFEEARRVLLGHLEFPTAHDDRRGDAKTELQERIQAAHHVTPTYRVVEERGPDHSKVFVVEILQGTKVLGTGEGKTKKEAEQTAAAAVLSELDSASEPDGG